MTDLHEKSLLVAMSKINQEGRRVQLYVTRVTRKAIKRYCDAAGITEGALFRRIRKGDKVTKERLTEVSAPRIIKAWAYMVAFTQVSGHSMRVGFAISLEKAGASVVDLQTAGRWRDPKMPAHYAAAVPAKQVAVAGFYEREYQQDW